MISQFKYQSLESSRYIIGNLFAHGINTENYYYKQDIYIFFIVLKFQSMDLAQTLGQLGLKTLFDPLRSNLTNFISEESQQSDRVSFNR